MEKFVIYMETGSTNPAYNLAFEEYILSHKKSGDYLLLWQNDNTIVIGQNQNTEEEINREFVEKHGIHVVRRTTGGGAVYHDLGNLNYSFITDAGEKESINFRRFAEPVVETLRALGLDAEASGRNDILVSGCKVSGTAQRILGSRVLHHGTLLFCSNPEMIAGALKVDPEKFKSKAVKSVRSRVGNIKSFLTREMELPEFRDYLKKTLSGTGFVQETLTPEEIKEVLKLKAEKYDTWEWNFGRSPQYERKNRRRFDGGTLECRLTVAEGFIRDIKFYGDFLATQPMDEAEKQLLGARFEPEQIMDALSRVPVSACFGGITAEEVVKTMFDLQ